MTKKAVQIGFLLAIAALVAFTAPAAQAIDFSYTQSGFGGSKAQACDDAVQKIKDKLRLVRPDHHRPGRLQANL